MIRIYNKVLNRWTYTDEQGRERLQQVEIEYKDFTEAGEVKGIGSEDFSPERSRSELENVAVYTWDGERLNKGGKRWFDFRGVYQIRKADRSSFREYIKTRYHVETVRIEK